MCLSKHVEPSINFVIINSITKLRLVGISTESYYDARIHEYQTNKQFFSTDIYWSSMSDNLNLRQQFCRILKYLFLLFLLPSALQPAVGFGLSNNTSPFFPIYHQLSGGTRWRVWLRNCATSRKVAGSIPDGVNVIFH